MSADLTAPELANEDAAVAHLRRSASEGSNVTTRNYFPAS
jgi:hypothetical protein